MKSSDLKEYIIENECVDTILDDLGCGHITKHGGYYTCSNPDGNNKSAVVIYINENLTVINYTRNIVKNKNSSDLFDLVAFYKDCTFAEALKYIHNILGLDYYQEREETCESLQILRMLKDMTLGEDAEEDSQPLKPISKNILQYYLPYPNKMFENDGISLEVQQEFMIGYDPQSNRVTIPLLSPTGDLCGVKGRLFGDADEYNPKYLYIEKTVKSKLLYGLYENRKYIKNSNHIFIFEAEKSVLQCASNGIRNCVALGGKSISKTQVELVVRTGCVPIISLDKGISLEEIKSVAAFFPEGIPVYYIFDNNDIMIDKQSPSDNFEHFRYLIKNHIYKIEVNVDGKS